MSDANGFSGASTAGSCLEQCPKGVPLREKCTSGSVSSSTTVSLCVAHPRLALAPLVGKSGGRAVERLSAELVEKGTPCVACSVVLSMKVTCPPSRAAHSAMWWRLHRSWALARPWEFCTLVPLSVALASWGGKSCLRWIDLHTFDARQHGDVWTRWCETAKNMTDA